MRRSKLLLALPEEEGEGGRDISCHAVTGGCVFPEFLSLPKNAARLVDVGLTRATNFASLLTMVPLAPPDLFPCLIPPRSGNKVVGSLRSAINVRKRRHLR